MDIKALNTVKELIKMARIEERSSTLREVLEIIMDLEYASPYNNWNTLLVDSEKLKSKITALEMEGK